MTPFLGAFFAGFPSYSTTALAEKVSALLD